MEPLPQRPETPPDHQLPPGGNKIQRISNQTQTLVQEIKHWMDLRIALTKLEIQQEIEARKTQAALIAGIVLFGALGGLLRLPGAGLALRVAFFRRAEHVRVAAHHLVDDRAGHVLKRRVLLPLVKQLGLALSNREETLPLRLHPPEENVAHTEEQKHGKQPHDDETPGERTLRLRHHLDPLRLQKLHELLVAERRDVRHKLLVLDGIPLFGSARLRFELPTDTVALDDNLFDVPVLELTAKLAIANALPPSGPFSPIAVGPQRKQ